MKLIRYMLDYFEVGVDGASGVKFAAGSHYPVSDETSRHVEHGIAEEVDAPEDALKAVAVAEKAESKADDAQVAADAARALADAATAAAVLAATPAE